MHEGDQKHRDRCQSGGNAEQRAVYRTGGAGFVQKMIQQVAAHKLTCKTGEEDQKRGPTERPGVQSLGLGQEA